TARAPAMPRRTGGRHHAESQSRVPAHPHSHAHATEGIYRNRSATWGARPGTRGLAGMSVKRNQAKRNDGIREDRPPAARALRISTSTVSAATVGAPTAGSGSRSGAAGYGTSNRRRYSPRAFSAITPRAPSPVR